MRKAYYKSWLGIAEVEIVAVEKYIDTELSVPVYIHKYLIKFMNGRYKLVNSDRVIIPLETT